METEQPTQEQIKEFWEWYGLLFKNEVGYHGWYKGIGTSGLERVSGLNPPEIDLNNLFEYAILKVPSKYDILLSHSPDCNEWHCDILGKQIYIGEESTPALALFWALWKVKGKNDIS